jgi:alpha-L-fucosidase 2
MENRGYGIFGWSIGWQINLVARLNDSERCYDVLRNLLTRPTQPNFLNVTQAFQIDGNLGGTAGIAEMLLQSLYHTEGGKVVFLPALPSAWPTGLVKGLRARGGFVVDIAWKDGKLTEAKITATQPRKLLAHWGNKTWKHTLKAGESTTIRP